MSPRAAAVTDFVETLRALTARIDQRLGELEPEVWRCRAVLPLPDGSADVVLRSPRGPVRIRWEEPDHWEPREVWSAGRFTIEQVPGALDRQTAETRLNAVAEVLREALAEPAGRLLRWDPPDWRADPADRWPAVSAARRLALRLAAGAFRVGPWTLSVSESLASGALRLRFVSDVGAEELRVGPVSREPELGHSRLRIHPAFAIDFPGAADEAALAGRRNQPAVRSVSFFVHRAFPTLAEPAEVAGGPTGLVQPGEQGLTLHLTRAPCDAACLFCSRSHEELRVRLRVEQRRFDFDAELRALERALERTAERDSLTIGGNEPGCYPTRDAVLALVRDAGFSQVVLQTNGIWLADPAAVERLRSHGVTRVRLPLYGVSAGIHDRVTGVPGSYDAVRAALRNLDEAGLSHRLETVVLRQNLGEMAALLRAHPDVTCSFVMPSTADPRDYASVCPRLSEPDPSVLDAVFNLYLPCVFPHRARDRVVVSTDVSHVEPDDSGRFAPPRPDATERALQRRVKAPRCRRCAASARCTGLYELYLHLYGDGELRPVSA